VTEHAAEPTPAILPWQRTFWQKVWEARCCDRLPHALLLRGPRGTGKRCFAHLLTQALLCSGCDAEGLPCGVCQSCRLFRAGNHPECLLVGPERDAKTQEIKVDAIRELTSREVLTTQTGGRKVIVIEPAHRMNLAAANGLLKTLEEPGANTLLLLVSAEAHRLPATIRSRCQCIDFPIPASEIARAWLREKTEFADLDLLLGLAGGAPFAALQFADPGLQEARRRALDDFIRVFEGAEDPVVVAEHWLEMDRVLLLDWMAGWLLDVLRLKNGASSQKLGNPDQESLFKSLAKRLDSKIAHKLLDQVLVAKGDADSTVNPQLMLEGLLIDWAEKR